MCIACQIFLLAVFQRPLCVSRVIFFSLDAFKRPFRYKVRQAIIDSQDGGRGSIFEATTLLPRATKKTA